MFTLAFVLFNIVRKLIKLRYTCLVQGPKELKAKCAKKGPSGILGKSMTSAVDSGFSHFSLKTNSSSSISISYLVPPNRHTTIKMSSHSVPFMVSFVLTIIEFHR